MSKTENKNYTDVITEKKAIMKMVEKCLDELESYEKYSIFEAVNTGERQCKNWEEQPLYRDADGKRTTEVTDEPIMENVYEYRLPKVMDDNTKAEVDALKKVRELLVSLI